jgi:hypothetical protein
MEKHIFYIPVTQFQHRLKKEYPLSEQFSLVPFPRKIEDEFRFFGHGYYKRHYGDLFLKEVHKGFALRYAWKTGRFKSPQELVYKIEDPIITFLIGLRIHRPTRAGLRGIFHYPPMSEGLPFDLIDYRTAGHVLRTDKELQPFREEDLAAANFYFQKIMGLLKNEYGHRRIFNALRFFDLGFRSNNVDSRLIYFSIAFEVIYKPVKGKLTRGMCQRAAAFLKKESSLDNVAKKIFEIFNLKARVIHGDMTYFEVSGPNAVQLVRDFEDLLRVTLQKILRSDELISVFSSIKHREAFFNDLAGDARPRPLEIQEAG